MGKINLYHELKSIKWFSFLLLTCNLVVVQHAKCQTVDAVAYKYLYQFTTSGSGQSITVADNSGTSAYFTDAVNFTDVAVNNYIKLDFDPDVHYYISGTTLKTYIAQIELKKYALNADSSAYNTAVGDTILLKVTYDPKNKSIYQDKQEFWFDNNYKVKATLLSVKNEVGTSYTLSGLPQSLRLEAGINIERYFDFDPEEISSTLEVSYDTSINHLIIQNFVIDQTPAYDIEWTYVNDYKGNALEEHLTESQAQFYFHNNSTRIQVNSDEPIAIPAIFDRGWVVFRVRALAKDTSDFEKWYHGEWSILDYYDKNNYDADSLPDYDNIASIENPNAFIYISDTSSTNLKPVHEWGKNWSYQCTYAEEGKMKHVVSYFDGVMFNRQNVTQNNTDDVALVGETIYDHQGRPAMQILPVPVTTSEIKYYPNFNKADSLGFTPKYNKTHFDLDLTDCSIEVLPMSESTGASNYYSPSNAEHSLQNAYIPDAENYPFVITRWEPDNSGRVSMQSGVGKTHKIDSSYTTRYIYEKPLQEELDLIFGANVGNMSYYNKSSIIDPNGQVSVSYTDAKGQVIATALAGAVPENMTALTTDDLTETLYDEHRADFEADLLGISDSLPHGANNYYNGELNSYTLNYPFFVPENDLDYHYIYTVNDINFSDSCLDEICLDCVYDLTIGLTNECGDQMLNNEGNPFKLQIGDMPSNSNLDSALSCLSTDSVNTQLTDDAIFNVVLDQGNYMLSKTLTLNQEALDFYAQMYVDTASCLLTLEDFIDSAMADLDTTGCYLDCDYCDSIRELSVEEYISANMDSAGSSDDTLMWKEMYYSNIQQCEILCEIGVGNDPCFAGYMMMLQDMSPGGQYAELYNPATGEIDVDYFALSVLNESNILQVRAVDAIEYEPNWRNPKFKNNAGDWISGYYDENGTTRAIIYPIDTGLGYYPESIDGIGHYTADGIRFIYPEEIKYVQDFVSLFQPSWASSLIIYHPEYFYYQYCAEDSYDCFAIVGSDTLNPFQFDEYLLSYSRDSIFNIDTNLIHIDEVDPYVVDDCGTGHTDLRLEVEYFETCTDATIVETATLTLWETIWMTNHLDFTRSWTCEEIQDTLNDQFNLTSPPSLWNYIQTDEDWNNLVSLYAAERWNYIFRRATIVSNALKAGNQCIGEGAAFYDADGDGILDIGFGDLFDGDICDWPSGIYYYDKIKRFQTPQTIYGISESELNDDDILVGIIDSLEAEGETAYFEYTGTLPLASDLQWFLQGWVNHTDGICATNPLNENPVLTIDLFNALDDAGFDDWEPQLSADSLVLKWASEIDTSCKLTLNFPSNIENHNWNSSIQNIMNIHVQDASIGTFNVQVVVKDDATDELLEYEATGSICTEIILNDSSILLSNCEPTIEASAIMLIMNNLLIHDNFNDASYTLATEEYEPLVPILEPYIGSNVPFKWEHPEATNDYYLKNADESREIKLSFNSAIPYITGDTSFFNDLNGISNPAFVGTVNNFSAIVYTDFPAVSPVTSVTGTMYWLNEATYEAFPVGDCDFPISTPCSDDEHYLLNDLQTLLNYVVVNNFVETGDSLILDDLEEAGYSSLFAEYSGGSTATDYWYVDHVSDYALEASLKNISGGQIESNCQIYLNINDPSAATFEELDSINYLVADFTLSIDEDNTYNFTCLGFNEGDSILINGTTSCIPLKNCGDCHSLYNYDLDTALVYVEVGFTISSEGTTIHYPNNNFRYRKIFDDSEYTLIPEEDTELYLPCNFYDGFSFKINEIYDPELGFYEVGDTTVVIGFWINKNYDFVLLADVDVETIDCTSFGFAFGVLIPGPDIAIQDCDSNYIGAVMPEFEYTNPCVSELQDIANYNGNFMYENYIDSIKSDFKQRYIAHCMTVLETFTVDYTMSQYQYTLYYYDQAGNLVQTVPPAGVVILNETQRDSMKVFRTTGNTEFEVYSDHQLATNYKYNSLAQLIWQKTPDAGESNFWYDYLGRLVLSQNAEQNKIYSDEEYIDFEKYSYTQFDNLGRIIEVGELWSSPDSEDAVGFYDDINDTENFPSNIAAFRYDVTSTYYNDAIFADLPFEDGQQYLRNRIASVTIEKTYDNNPATYNSATHYSYDIHGNVNELIQDNYELAVLNQQFKRLAYIYDLLSGNVHFVKYQQDSIDQFYHKYTYDADNRIRTVETSRDQKIWEQDAKYFYYAHGPLARTEIGDNDVQGTDFAYTIQGWLKGVNSTALNTAADMGKDAKTGGGTLHLHTASDAFGFVLEYFKGDYTQINISGVNKDFMASQKNAGGYFPYYTSTPDLYNGNIRAMSTALMDTGRTKVNVLGKTYTYDQLNRIKSSYSFEKSNMHLTGGFSWIGLNSTNKWATEYNYDGNGNILKHRRSGDSTVLWTMDSLTYYYYEGTNQLKYVHDGSASGNYNVDIDNQTDTNNYVYDAIGNLTGDDAEGIQKIKWNVYGKIESIKFTGASGKPDLVFGYDAMGNRISKKVMPQSAGDTITTYYVRDATGNTMATYLRKGYTASDTLRLSEQHIYGSSRLGMVSTSLLLSEQLDTSNIYTRLLGEKRYELSNHLGNVLAVITDRRFSIQSGATTTIAYYEPDVLAAQDYDPFGMLLEGRNWEGGSEYRYGFNTQEQDDEVYGNGNLNTAEFWEYDTRLGRRWNVDPKGQFDSKYVSFGNNPLNGIDYDGAWFWEKSNVRQARKFAKVTGGEFDKWKSEKDGTTKASVTFNASGSENIIFDSEAEAYRLSTQYVGTKVFEEGKDYTKLLEDVGIGFYKAQRANAQGLKRMSWALKSLDAYARGEQEYDRSGQAPGIIKGIVGLNPEIALINGSKVLVEHVGNWTNLNEQVPSDIYSVNANSVADVSFAVGSILTGGLASTASKSIGQLAFKGSLKVVTDATITGASFANDAGWLDPIKYGKK